MQKTIEVFAMCKLLMSINPQYVDEILAGNKLFEFRKTKCRKEIDAIVIYSTAPVMKVVAEVKVKNILIDTPKAIWEQTSYAAGVRKDFFDTYFHGKNSAIAYALGRVERFERPKDLSEYGVKSAPQSYVYVN